jgi:hypothetical protein
MSPLPRRMIDDMQIRNLSAHTRRAYVSKVFGLPVIFANLPSISDQLRSARICST